MYRTSMPRPVRTARNARMEMTERTLKSRYHWAILPDDVMTVVSVDSTNHVVYCKRPGDTAAHTGYPHRYFTPYAPAVNDTVVRFWGPTGPYIKGKQT